MSKLSNEGFKIKRGKIIYDHSQPREKGTDVKIAVDLIIGAIDNWYDTAILLSSDTDLIPAVQYLKYKKKRIEYIGFSHAPSKALQKLSDGTYLLTSQKENISTHEINIEQFITKKYS